MSFYCQLLLSYWFEFSQVMFAMQIGQLYSTACQYSLNFVSAIIGFSPGH